MCGDGTDQQGQRQIGAQRTGSCNRDADRYNDDDQGDDRDGEPEDELAELIQGQVRTTLVLADDSNNKKICLGFSGNVDRDDGGDGYFPLRVFGLGFDGDDDGNSGGGDGDGHQQAGRAEDQTNR
jgi:hypothetical protein